MGEESPSNSPRNLLLIFPKNKQGLLREIKRDYSKKIPSIDLSSIRRINYCLRDTINKKEQTMSEHVFERIYEVVKQIPKGKVATYGQIAAMAGNPRWARVVGYALHANPDPEHIPCYRVVNRNGEVSKAFVFGGENAQIKLLQADGITVTDGRVDLTKYRW